MLSIDFIGAQVLHANGFSYCPLSIAEGVVSPTLTGFPIDLSGFRILPGIIDVHGDGFERHLAPRRGAMKQLGEGLRATEAELGANGITTAVLAQFVSWEGGLRGLEFADRVFSAIKEFGPELVTDLHPQLRFETCLVDLYESLPERVAQWGVRYVVFNDHLPHARLAKGLKPPRITGQALKAGRDPEIHFQMMLDLHSRSDEVMKGLRPLCAALIANGVRLGSHDDSSTEIRDLWHERGALIAEFPETSNAAKAAKVAGDSVVLGAPNLVRGRSHKGNISALELVLLGKCNALASDYHYPSPRRAALMLAQSGILDFKEAWALVSSGPADMLGLTDRGRLASGLRADIVILNVAGQVAATFSGGRMSYMSGNIAERFMPVFR